MGRRKWKAKKLEKKNRKAQNETQKESSLAKKERDTELNMKVRDIGYEFQYFFFFFCIFLLMVKLLISLKTLVLRFFHPL